jgi:cobyrinic acid a,c-diamide synthase
MKTIVVAGAASGVGKTTVTLAIMAALGRRGLVVQGFKIGPDFIDPAFHALVTGRPSYTLDGWMCGRDAVCETVARHGASADVAVIEGVMGCFDGIDGVSEEGSTAQVAKWLGAPVLLVVDARASSRSVAAVVLGFEAFDPALHVAGVVVNNAGSATHGRWVLDAIAQKCRAVPLGALGRDADLTLPERHLGLVTAAEGPLTPERQSKLADALESAVDLDRLLAIASQAPGAGNSPAHVPPPHVIGVPRHASREIPRAGSLAPERCTIGVARDLAFQFYYEENLARLREAGAEIVFWSPEHDAELPDVDGLYFGGGYPELRAKALSANGGVRRAVRKFVEAGGVAYAECGGLMYLADALQDDDGVTHEMVGILPATVRMRPRRMTLAYTTVTTTAATLFGDAGLTARGHEFHYSTLDPVPPSVPRVYRVTTTRGDERAEGYQVGNALLSYSHLHFASNPALAPALVAACAQRRV